MTNGIMTQNISLTKKGTESLLKNKITSTLTMTNFSLNSANFSDEDNFFFNAFQKKIKHIVYKNQELKI